MSRRLQSPRLIRVAARLLLPARDREIIIGDLEELYATRVRLHGAATAARRYVRDVISSVVARRFARSRRPRPPNLPPFKPRRCNVLDDFGTDLRHAGRSLRRRPGFTVLVVTTLALGIGASAAVFGMANQLLLRPLPGVRDPGAAAYLQFRSEDYPGRDMGLPLLEFEELRRSATSFDGIASYGYTTLHVSVAGERPREVRANTVLGDFFEVLGVRPTAGRLLSAAETGLGSDPFVVVISERLWDDLFQRSASVAGRTLQANGHTLTVIGVAGDGFAGPERGSAIDMWLPFSALIPLVGFTEERLLSRESTMHDELVVRPTAGVRAAAADGEVAALLRNLVASGVENADYLRALTPVLFSGLHVPPLVRTRTYASLRILGGAVALVLLLACANVANLLLFRSVERRGDVAVSRALGASRGRIARARMTETLLLAAAASGLGLGAAWLIALPLSGERLLRMPAFEGMSFDGRVFLFAIAAGVLTALLCGALPAALAGRFDLGYALRHAGERDTGRGTSLRQMMAACQVALSLMLLVGGVLLTRTVRNLNAVDTGLDVQNVARLTLDFGTPRYDGVDLGPVHRRILDAIRATPGVEAVALDVYGPFSSRMGARVGLPGTAESDVIRAFTTSVTSGWFELLGVDVLSGRTFTRDDWEPGAPKRIVLTAALARRLFGTTQVAGRRASAGFFEMEDAEIIGVVGDLRLTGPRYDPDEAFFTTYQHSPLDYVTVLARTRVLDAATAEAILESVESAVDGLPIPAPTLLSDRLDQQLSEQRVFARLIGLFSGLALLLATVGLYGVVAFAVAGRRREFGIRMAIGADYARIVSLVAKYATVTVVAGAVIGLAGAYGLAHVLESRLFGVEPLDPASYFVATFLLTTVSLVASWAPARSAARVDPVVTLRHE